MNSKIHVMIKYNFSCESKSGLAFLPEFSDTVVPEDPREFYWSRFLWQIRVYAYTIYLYDHILILILQVFHTRSHYWSSMKFD